MHPLSYARPGTAKSTIVKWPIAIAALVLMAIAVAAIYRARYQGRTVSNGVPPAKLTIRTLEGAVDLFAEDTARYPTESEGLDALQRMPPAVNRWQGPYFKGDIRDPWGTPYVYRLRGGTPVIISAGRDRTLGTGDDLDNTIRGRGATLPPPREEP